MAIVKTISKGKRRKTKRKGKKVGYRPSRGLSGDLQTYDVGGTLSPTNANAVYAVLNAPVPGTGTNTRIGDRIRIKSIQLRLLIVPNVLQAGIVEYVRWLLVWDRQPNGALPASPLPLLSTAVEIMPNVDYKYRFEILKDELNIVADDGSVTPVDTSNSIFNFYKKCHKVSQYTGSAGTIADIASGSLLLVAYGNGAVTPSSIVYYSRIHYEN
jgi:hypothetical protein